MKKLLFCSVILVLFTMTVVSQTMVQINGKLSVKGTSLINEKGQNVMLQGVSYGWHNWWPRFYNKESVKWLADDWGCTVIRAAMGVGPQRSYLDQPEWSQKLIESVVEGAIERDIYVIIDWHSHEIQLEAAKKFFSEMARKFGNKPHVIYEIFNEPVNDSWEVIKNYSIEVIKTIREIDPDNIILVGCPHWDQDIHIAADSPIQGYTNLMYTLHFYADTHRQYLRDRADYAIGKGLPLFVSESAGMAANGDGPINYDEWNNWIEWMKKNQVSWITWSISDKNETCSMLAPSAASTGDWKAADMKESGIKTRELLRNDAKINAKK
jgi:endoglucanase